MSSDTQVSGSGHDRGRRHKEIDDTRYLLGASGVFIPYGSLLSVIIVVSAEYDRTRDLYRLRVVMAYMVG